MPTQNNASNTLTQNNASNKLTCKFCDKNYARIDIKTRHLKTCKKKQEAEATKILQELWLCREREIIRNISIARDMDYDSLMADFGSK